MSVIPATFSSRRFEESSRYDAGNGLFKRICEVGHALRDLRMKMRFGALSRAPLRLLRFEMTNNIVECDWMARSADPWDTDLTRKVQQRHASLQVLRDAIDIRGLIFSAMPQVEAANLRVFRESQDYMREMIVTGCVHRIDQSSRDVHSIVMRAKVLGFRFHLEDDVLRNIYERWH